MGGEQAQPTIRSCPQPAVPIFEQGVNRIVRQAVTRREVLNLRIRTSAVQSMIGSKPKRPLPICQQGKHALSFGFAEIQRVELRA
jgi:hypothetical protein